MNAVERGAELRKLRRTVGRTQKAVADHFGLTVPAVSEWERGLSSPSWQRIRSLDDFLDAQGQVLALFNLGSDEDDLRVVVADLVRRVALLEQPTTDGNVIPFPQKPPASPPEDVPEAARGKSSRKRERGTPPGPRGGRAEQDPDGS